MPGKAVQGTSVREETSTLLLRTIAHDVSSHKSSEAGNTNGDISAEQVVSLFLSSHSRATDQAYNKDLSALAKFLAAASPEEAGLWLLGAPSSEVNLVAATWQRHMLSSGLSPAVSQSQNRRCALTLSPR